jgi:hypothetical protein
VQNIVISDTKKPSQQIINWSIKTFCSLFVEACLLTCNNT